VWLFGVKEAPKKNGENGSDWSRKALLTIGEKVAMVEFILCKVSGWGIGC